jgi:hypothetical protein
LSQDELDAWERTPRTAALSTKRTELQRAAPDDGRTAFEELTVRAK